MSHSLAVATRRRCAHFLGKIMLYRSVRVSECMCARVCCSPTATANACALMLICSEYACASSRLGACGGNSCLCVCVPENGQIFTPVLPGSAPINSQTLVVNRISLTGNTMHTINDRTLQHITSHHDERVRERGLMALSQSESRRTRT